MKIKLVLDTEEGNVTEFSTNCSPCLFSTPDSPQISLLEALANGLRAGGYVLAGDLVLYDFEEDKVKC